jgi:hypothetical protein
VIEYASLNLRLGSKTGSALVEDKISASPRKPDICALMSTRSRGRVLINRDGKQSLADARFAPESGAKADIS